MNQPEEFTCELMDCTRVLLEEVHDNGFTRIMVARTYAMALRSSDNTDWRAVNSAIIERWSHSALEWIKNNAHSGRCFDQ